MDPVDCVRDTSAVKENHVTALHSHLNGLARNFILQKWQLSDTLGGLNYDLAGADCFLTHSEVTCLAECQ